MGCLAFVSGCAGDSEGSSAKKSLPSLSALGNPDHKVTVTWLDAANTNVNVGSTIKKFEAEYPNITIKYESIPYADFETVLPSRLTSGKVDVITVDQPLTARYVAAGYLSDITPVFKSEFDALDKASLAGSTVDGKLYNAPEQSDSSFLFYNKDLLGKAGVALPSSTPSKPTTWERITADAKKAQKAGAEHGITWERISNWYYQWPLAQGLGGGYGADGPDSLTPNLDSEAAVKAFSWYAGLYKDKVSPQGDANSVYTSLFASGKSAFHIGGDWNIAELNKNKDLDYGIAPMPKFAGGQAVSNAGGVGLGLYTGSKNTDAALTFINAMVFKGAGAAAYNSETSSPPANDEGKKLYWAQEVFQDPRAADAQKVVDHQLSHGIAKERVSSVGWNELSSALSSALLSITNGEDVEKALKSAQSTAGAALEKYK
ncbi:ABC transporter substrate-binding protein [Streptomyces shenzhenensis]|uniref:ABC transporter substrate-binding protein n=1 Tax=Streptomyces shenzhenensis TaxID=943815 RepID=UPI0036A48864